MIVELVFKVVVGLVGAILSILPTTPTPPDLAGKFSSAFGGIGPALGFVNVWFPVSELAVALGGLLGFMVAIHLVRLIAWVLALVHIGGTDA